ncbi:MAG: hypothetical protein HY555_00150 [Euryarchaeota archaeon]|nr:hypothetical protein [Euryarchaeota archaeon]
MPQKHLWSSILKFLYAWSLLAVIVWGPIYASAARGMVAPSQGNPDGVGDGAPSLLKVGDHYTFTVESRRHLVHLTFVVAEEAREGFLIHTTYRQVKLPSQGVGMEFVYPAPLVQVDQFLVDRQGRPLGVTLTSGYWASLWQR